MQGLLLVDKPSGWTSFDVVNKVRRMAAVTEGKKPKNCKVGHTGTLDPLATGLLVLLVGKDYTRRAQELTKLDKTYEVVMKLGETSSTGDAEGVINPYCHSEQSEASSGAEGRSFDSAVGFAQDDREPSPEAIQEALQAFTGQIMQVPPAFSAIKIDGKRAYDLARAGKAVELEARPVTIHTIQLTKYAYPFVEFTTDVSSGTYIRSLVEDIGVRLGTGAYMSALRRTRIGQFNIGDAANINDITTETLAGYLFSV